MFDYFTNDPHAVYVTVAYGLTITIMGWLVWSTLRANSRARREMEEAERARGRR